MSHTIESLHADLAALCDRQLARTAAFLASLVTETRNRAVGSFTRHERQPDEAGVISSQPFALVILAANGAPMHVLQRDGATARTMMAMASAECLYCCLSAEQVRAKLPWARKVATELCGRFTSLPEVRVAIWSADTLSRYLYLMGEMQAEAKPLMDAIRAQAK